MSDALLPETNNSVDGIMIKGNILIVLLLIYYILRFGLSHSTHKAFPFGKPPSR
jgi:hypothetical protein